MTAVVPGRCQYCRCTESNACVLATGDPCAWYDAGRTCCTNPACIKQFERGKRQPRGESAQMPPRYGARYKGWGYGAIVKDLRQRTRAAARRKRRAA